MYIPNLVNESFIIKINKGDDIGLDYSLTDQTGRMVLRGQLQGLMTRIDILHLAPGVYFIEMEGFYQKLLKQ